MFRDYKIAYLRRHVRVKEAQPLTFLRESVAYVLSQSARRIPHAAGIVQFDVTPLVEYCQAAERALAANPTGDKERDFFRRALYKNYSAFFLKALAHGLCQTPTLNGFLEYTPFRNGGTLYVAEDINFGFTVHTKFGVIKPIVRNPHTKDIETVAREMKDLARRARKTDPEELYRRAAKAYLAAGLRELDLRGLGALWRFIRATLWPRAPRDPALKHVPEEERLRVSDILGATCTLANIGMMFPGHQTVTVIIPPEVTMFGIGDLHKAPLVVGGKVEPRHVVTICTTMDHRAYDAGDAFPLRAHVQRYIENPALIYEWKPGDPI